MPEALRFDLQGYWSRRINHEHRLAYKYDDTSDALVVAQCRCHYLGAMLSRHLPLPATY